MIDKVSNTSKMNLISSDEAFRRTSHTAKTMSSFEIELAKAAKAARANGDSIDKIAHALKLSASSVKSLIDLQIDIPMTRREREEEMERLASQEEKEEETDVDEIAKQEHLASAEDAYVEMYGKSFAKKKINIMASGKSIPKSRKGDWSETGGPKRQLRYNNSIWDADILKNASKKQDNGERIREENARIKAERQQARYDQTHVTTDDMYQKLRESVDFRKSASVQQTSGSSQESYKYDNRVQRNGLSIFDNYEDAPFDRIAEKTEGERERDISRSAKKKDRSWVKTASTNSMKGKFQNMIDSLIDDETEQLMPVNNANGFELLNDMNKLTGFLAAKGLSLPANWNTLSPQQKQEMLNGLIQSSQQTGQVADKVHEFANQQKSNLEDMQNAGIQQPTTQPAIAQSRGFNLKRSAAKAVQPKVAFNLKRAQMEPPAPMQMPQSQPAPAPAPQPEEQDQSNGQCPSQFSDAGQLQQCLESFASAEDAINFFGDEYTNEGSIVSDPDNPSATGEAYGLIKETLNDFFSTDDPSVKMKVASILFDSILPQSAKTQQSNDETQQNAVPSQEQQVNPGTLAMVRETNEVIRRLAEAFTTKKASKKVFNLKKQAQHQSIHNIIYFGPGQNKVDAFTGQQISDWHLVERNKGFGLKIDDVLDVDFEAIWRGSVMDKYSRPYKDKEGNWIGGYLEGRFETDRNVPPMNNLQLKPGQLRRPIVPEHGTTESRMEAARTKMNTDRGYDPASKGKPFNWKEASKKKAQLEPPKNEGLMMPGDEPQTNLQPKPVCRICGGDIAKMGGQSKHKGVCVNCAARMPNPNMVAPGQSTPQQQPMMLQKTPKMSQTQQSHMDGIYFDSKKFIVYAQGNRAEFNSFAEAEAFNSQPVDGQSPPDEAQPQPDEKHPVKSKLNRRQREVYDAADRLHIDG